MQTTLLGLAIAAIMALVAALAAPLFVDWNEYKPQFEAEATRVVGAPVRVEGTLDARLLPTPILRLHKLSVGAPKDATRLTADKLDVEFSLGSLLRGEWRATQLSLTGLALDVGLDKDGRVIAPAKGEFNFGELAIDRLDLAGRVTLHDAASGGTRVLDGLDFRGDVRSLGGNLRGEGSFLLYGARQPFRLALSKAGANEATRLRLDLDPAEAGGVASSLDGTLAFENRVPRFAGALTLSAADQMPSATGRMPWRISARTTLDPAGATFTQGEVLSGAGATGLKLAGEGALTFKQAKLRVALSAPQLDLDRALAENKTLHGKTPAALLTDAMAGLPALPWPAQIDVSVDRANVAGHTLNALSARFAARDDVWAVKTLEFGGPGQSRVALSGQVTRGSGGAHFAGPVSVEVSDARAFAEWAFGKSDLARALRGDLHLKAAMTLATDELVLDGMTLDLSGTRFEGRVARGAKEIDVTLRSPFVDADRFADIVRESMAWREKAGRALHARLDFEKAKILDHDVAPLQTELASVADGGSPKRQAFDVKLRRMGLAPWLTPDTAVGDVAGRLVVANDAFALQAFSGKLGTETVAGNLSLSREGERSLSGNIDVGTLDVRAVLAAMLGAQAHAATEPLAQGWFGWRGSLAVKADKALLPGGAEATSASGTLRGDGASLALDNGTASIGGGELGLSGIARRGAADTTIEASLKLDKADAAALKYRALALPPGQASLRMTLATHGRSAAALRNALSGNGVLTLADVRLPRLAAATFDMVDQASEKPMKSEDLKDAVALALDQAPLAAASADVSFAIKDGRLHADPAAFRAEAAQATVSGGYDIPEEQGDLRIAFKATSSALKDAPGIQIFLHGTPDGITRDVDVAALSSWLSLRAIERETQRLDALEKEGRPPPKLQLQVQPQTQSQPQVQAEPPRSPAAAPVETSLPFGEVKLPAHDPRRRKAAVPPPSPPASPPPRLSPDARVVPLPPPIDIKPAPGVLHTPRAPRSSATF